MRGVRLSILLCHPAAKWTCECHISVVQHGYDSIRRLGNPSLRSLMSEQECESENPGDGDKSNCHDDCNDGSRRSSDLGTVGINPQSCIVRPCTDRTLESQALIVELLHKSPARPRLFGTDLLQDLRVLETGEVGPNDLELPIPLQIGIGVFRHFFFLLSLH